MRLIPGPVLSTLLHNLSQQECLQFLSILASTLARRKYEERIPDAERLLLQPLRTTFMTKDKNLSLFMPFSDTSNTGIKIVTSSARMGLVGVIDIFTPEGQLDGLLNATEITAFRTALCVMTLFVRTRSLNKENIVIFGSGRQAEWHARLALLLASPGTIKRITVVNRGKRRLEKMESELFAMLRQRYPELVLEGIARDADGSEQVLQSALAESDVIFSCTPATEPNFPYSYLQRQKKKRFISLIGSYKPFMKEIDTDTVLSGTNGTVYVDSKEACLEESGELIDAQVQPEQLIEIGQLFLQPDNADIDVSAGEGNIVFKVVGMGLMDLVVGKKILDFCREHGLGIEVDGF